METLRARFSNPLFLIAFRQWRVFPDWSRRVRVARPVTAGTRSPRVRRQHRGM